MFYKTGILAMCLFLGIASCGAKRNNSAQSTIFYTEDSLFRVEAIVPVQMDSFYVWVDRDDTNCGHQRKYRFSSRQYPILKESGFFYSSYPDSSYRLTFSHTSKYNCQETGWRLDVNALISRLKEWAEKDSVDFSLYSAEKMEIGDLDFEVIKFKTDLIPTQDYPSTLIWSFTKIDGIDFKIAYECAAKDCQLFIKEMEASLKSIRITKNE